MMKLDSLDLSLINQDLHWAFKYLGTPWERVSSPPESFDCWSFFRYVQEQHFNVSVPSYAVDPNNFRAVAHEILSADERENWIYSNEPEEGCAVLMAHAKYPSHVGVWLDVDGGGVLHCIKGEGVVFSSLSSLQTCGWSRVEFYRNVKNVSNS